MTAETWGISDMPAKVAPPLKSTSTMLSCSGEWVIARPSTSVRRNSDLPDPVAPMTRPWGPMPCLRALLDVEVDHAPALAEADRDAEPVARGPWPPGGVRVEDVDVAEAEQVHEVQGSRDLAAGVGPARTDGVERGEPPREGLGRGQVALVGGGLDRFLAHADGEHRDLAPVALPGGQLEPQPAGVVELVPPCRQVEHGDAVQPVRRYDVVAGRRVAPSVTSRM